MLTSLLRSASPVVFRALFGIILIGSLFMMSYAAWNESATFDESAHIPAGYAYVRYLDFRLNPEHPPLLKALSGVPLLFMDLTFPTHLDAWQKEVNGQWVMGGNFFYESGNDGQMIVRMARIAPVFLTILLAFLIYYWASRLLGRWWALIPTFLFAWSPNIIAHGHYVTTDIAASFGIALATLFFVRFLFAPSRRHLVYAGLAFGTAQLLKFSAVLLIPYFLLLIALFYAFTVLRDFAATDTRARLARFLKRGFLYLRSTLLIFVIGYVLVVYPVYFLFTVHYPGERQATDTAAILSWFEPRFMADLAIEGARHRITQPLAEYSLGVMTAFQRSQGGNANYFLGKVSGSGTPLYFPLVYLVKEPLPILILTLGALFYGIYLAFRALRGGRSLRDVAVAFSQEESHFTIFALLLFIAIYWFTSITSPLNIGLRHLFPILPFIYILATWAVKRWIMGPTMPDNGFLAAALVRLQRIPTMIIRGSILGILLLWLALETVFAAPHFLSYFNQFGGGTDRGYRIVTDSNYDWGQDLLRLEEFVETMGIQKIAVDYFGGGSPRYFLGDRAENWWSARGNPADHGIQWLAVSVNSLEGSIQPTKGHYERKPEDEYRWLTELRPPKQGFGELPPPDYRAGTSIFIYALR